MTRFGGGTRDRGGNGGLLLRVPARPVALALTETFDVSPENIMMQGYGEDFLEVSTEGPEQLNRRATTRRITPLLQTRS